MARRPRKHIPLTERYAAALACLLPPDLCQELRAERVPAKRVIAMFSDHHVDLHAWGGSDRWWNLHPMPRPQHAERTRKLDIPRAAKAVRIEDKWRGFMNAVSKGRKPKPRTAWNRKKRKMPPHKMFPKSLRLIEQAISEIGTGVERRRP
jgi:hypothetical protein